MHSRATTEPPRPPPPEALLAAMRRSVRLAAATIPFFALFAAPPLRAQSLLPLSDYQVILDRKPFGELGKPKESGADAEATQAAAEAAQAERDQQTLAQQLDLVAVNITLRGTVSVGLVDKSVNPSRSLYLAVGESDSGYTVESADYAAETATISKGGVRVTLKLGRGLVESDGAAAGETAAGGAAGAGEAAEAEPRRQVPRVLRRPGAPGAAGYRSAIMERRRAENAAANEAESRRRENEVERLRQASDKAAAKREHDMNYQLLLEGKEPVSEIHLTPEEERELESRGLLAPADSAQPSQP